MIRAWCELFPSMADVVPDGATHGRATVRHVTVSPEQAAFSALRAMFNRGRGQVEAGATYAQLVVDGQLWMSDTPDERNDHRPAVANARGQVLIAGLGLGLVTLACALRPEVDLVTVIELDPDVVALVGPYLARHTSKVRIVQADVFTWRPEPGRRFDAIWLDVWPTLCADHLPEYHRLHRRVGRWRAPGSWRGSWGYDVVRALAGPRTPGDNLTPQARAMLEHVAQAHQEAQDAGLWRTT